MEININNEKLSVCPAVCHTKSEFNTECDIIVPDSKPDISRILQISARAKVTSCETQTDRVILSGTISFNILYLADNEEKCVCSIDSSCVFSNLFTHSGITEGMLTIADAEVSSLSYDLANCRKLTAKAALCGCLKVYDRGELNLISSIDGARMRRTELSSTVIRAFSESTATVTDSFELSAGKMSISEILKSDAEISDSDIKIIDDKAIIKGTIAVTTLYCAEGKLDYIETELPFAQVIDVQGIRGDMMVDYTAKITDLSVRAADDAVGEKRILDIDAELFFRVTAKETVHCSAVTDAFIPRGALNCQSSPVRVSSIEGTVHNEINFKELITLPEAAAPIETVYETVARPFAEKCEIIGDKLKISGYTEVYILYLSHDALSPVYSYKADIDFSVVTDAPDCTLTPSAECRLKSLSYVIGGERSIEIRGSLAITTQCIRSREEIIVSDAKIEEYAPPKRPSIIISYASEDRSLWDIAKEYNVAEEDILSANALENEDALSPCAALIIPK